ncbi:hypothetical protein [Nocardiopsis metallicus]|uniref:Ferric oxidoreductase domain-containing protein n=1 Tax=Nocardiopsis metallicus TaxID=179819 RepID=A0A840WAA8_9ACTN|nr:hypothetical protein [Nocardiopsis metallicus]MBB5493074.1 hypothetical protein [Nocardiopsis metallicus]
MLRSPRSTRSPRSSRPAPVPGPLRRWGPERATPRRPLGDRAARRHRPWLWASFLAGLLLANTLLALTAPDHMGAVRHLQNLLWTYSGVLALIGLTATAVMGLVCADRLVLSPRHRVLFQAAHRSLALLSCGFLIAHVVLQVAFTRINPAQLLLPLGVDAAVATGIIATDLLLVVVVTSLYRGRFAGTRYAWVWRTVHLGAYLCWPLAIVHGLTAGRAAPGWVLVCYLLCLFAVAAALVVRLVVTVRPVPEPDEARAGTELLSPVAVSGETDDELAFWSSIRTRS